MKFAVLPLRADDLLVIRDDGKTRTVIARATSIANACAIAAKEMGFEFEIAVHPGDYLVSTLLNKSVPHDP